MAATEDNFPAQFDIFDDVQVVEFHYWNALPALIKIKILKYAPFPTLRNFMLLSKESYELVRRIRIPTNVYLLERTSRELKRRYGIRNYRRGLEFIFEWFPDGIMDLSKHQPFHNLLFLEKEEGCCFVQRFVRKRRRTFNLSTRIGYNTGILAAAFKTLFNIAKYMDILDLSVLTNSPFEEIEGVIAEMTSTVLIAREKLFMETNGEPSATTSLLRFLHPGCEMVLSSSSELREPFSDHSFWNSETVRASRDIQVLFPVGIRDDELSQLRTKYLMMNTPFVTSHGIAQLIMVRTFCSS
ncbi:F-box domain protein [Oesophagostomum dentatum]|uniref:F-box domain protein n=1 Tax=Oesophagostomum dentatum TaxID=61180 RepID=A0A0B1TP87_OESDE|nr:F-box domain protein [Oesophagostomum dentatum]